VLETRYPWRVLRHELRADPGAGRQRGGLGCEAEYEIMADHLEISCIACRGRVPPRGRAGGHNGQLTEVHVIRGGTEYLPTQLQANIICPTKFSGLILRRGDRLRVRSPGGAGFGDPKERDRNLVSYDLRVGYVSARSAVEVYGISNQEVATLVPVEA
jgi:N-methylhydantoinase B/oxoprolinase/acetone carboxylase alpha subunit